MDLSGLNERQCQAVIDSDGPSIVTAGPGTGKTRTLAYRIAYLINEKKVLPENILAVTFTKSAARELKERVTSLLKGISPLPDLQNLWIETFHAMSQKILRNELYPQGLSPHWLVATDEEKTGIARSLTPPKQMRTFLEENSRRKSRFLPPQNEPQLHYQSRLLALNRLDFDDLLYYTHELFNNHPVVLDQYRKKWSHVLVDEFQDTSFAQYEILRQLRVDNFCAIGDPDQSIYGFADGGAQTRFNPFEKFSADFKNIRSITLKDNYRSQGAIIRAAQQIIGQNPSSLPRELLARLSQGLPLEITSYQSDRQEAEMIVQKIESLLGGASAFTIDSQWAQKEQETYNYSFGDIAILYRVNAQAKLLSQILERAGLPHEIYGKKSAEETAPETPAALDIENHINADAPKGEMITLMTLHRSKGLEFPVVFIAGCEDGLLPLRRQEEGPAYLDEERRLLYVGMTRAKNRLFLSHASKRRLWGLHLPGAASPFLNDIKEALRLINQPPPNPKPKEKQLTLFKLD